MKWNSSLYDNEHDFVPEYGKELLEFVPDRKNQTILDLGCGTGALTVELSKRCDYILGIDGSEDMIKKASETYKNLDFKVMDALKMTYKQKWDIVFSNAVFHWIPNQKLLLEKIKNSLKPSGKLVCEFGAYGNIQTIEKGFSDALRDINVDYISKFTFPKVEEFKRLLEDCGFYIEKLYDYNRPTPLKDGKNGLYNWSKQFFDVDLKRFSDDKQNMILKNMMDKVEDKLWDGEKWIADYKRLRMVAYV